MRGSGHRPPRVALFGLFGITNLGNDATLEAALFNIREAVPGVRLTCVAHEPDGVVERFGLPSVYISQDPKQPSAYREAPETWLPNPVRRILTEPWRWMKTLWFLRTVDHLIMPGTGLLDDFGNHPLQHPYQLWKWTVAAKLTRTPVHFVSIGAGPIGYDLSRRFFTRAARNASYRSFRDQESKDFTAGIDVDTTDDEVVPDLVFRLPLRVDPRPPAGDTIETVGIGLIEYHSWRNQEGDEDDVYDDYIAGFASFASQLLEDGKSVRILTGQVEDMRAVEDLQHQVRTLSPEHADRLTAAPIESIHDLFAEIAKTDAVVASRFHNVLCSVILGKPVVSIGYATKNDRLMETFDLGEFCQFIGSFDGELLREQFAKVTADPSEMYIRLRSQSERNQAALERHFADIAARL